MQGPGQEGVRRWHATPCFLSFPIRRRAARGSQTPNFLSVVLKVDVKLLHNFSPQLGAQLVQWVQSVRADVRHPQCSSPLVFQECVRVLVQKHVASVLARHVHSARSLSALPSIILSAEMAMKSAAFGAEPAVTAVQAFVSVRIVNWFAAPR
jgi:hypothetical protein